MQTKRPFLFWASIVTLFFQATTIGATGLDKSLHLPSLPKIAAAFLLYPLAIALSCAKGLFLKLSIAITSVAIIVTAASSYNEYLENALDAVNPSRFWLFNLHLTDYYGIMSSIAAAALTLIFVTASLNNVPTIAKRLLLTKRIDANPHNINTGTDVAIVDKLVKAKPLTASIVTLAILLGSTAATIVLWKQSNDLAALGAMVQACGSAIAFVWLIQTYRSQRLELNLQLHELINSTQATHTSLLMQMGDGLIAALGTSFGSIILALRDRPKSADAAESAFRSGNPVALAQAMINDGNLQKCLQLALTEKDQLVIGLIESYLSKHQAIDSLIGAARNSEILRMAILQQNPIRDATSILKHTLTTSISDPTSS